MSGIVPGFLATGLNVYANVLSRTDGSRANGAALEAYNVAHWANYVISSPEQSGAGTYVMSIPSYLPAGTYKAIFYLQLGGSPASGDTPIDSEYFDWDGVNLVAIGSGLNVTKINGSSPAAVNLALSANAFAVGAAAAGTLTTSQMTTNLVASVANIYAGRVLYFTSGVNAGLAALVTAYAVTGGKLTFIAYNNLPAPSAPGVGDTFLVV
jgi:hypothetical protein